MSSDTGTDYRRWSGVDSASVEALLDELSESPLPGARYARDVVRLRVRAIEDESWNAALREVEGRVLQTPADHHHSAPKVACRLPMCAVAFQSALTEYVASLRKPGQPPAPEEGK